MGKRSKSKSRHRPKDSAADLDLSVEMRPIGGYFKDRMECVRQMFQAVKGPERAGMLPLILKSISEEELMEKCCDELTMMSKQRIRSILNGKELVSSSESEESNSSADEDRGDEVKLPPKVSGDRSIQDAQPDSTSASDLPSQLAPDGAADGSESQAAGEEMTKPATFQSRLVEHVTRKMQLVATKSGEMASSPANTPSAYLELNSPVSSAGGDGEGVSGKDPPALAAAGQSVDVIAADQLDETSAATAESSEMHAEDIEKGNSSAQAAVGMDAGEQAVTEEEMPSARLPPENEEKIMEIFGEMLQEGIGGKPADTGKESELGVDAGGSKTDSQECLPGNEAAPLPPAADEDETGVQDELVCSMEESTTSPDYRDGIRTTSSTPVQDELPLGMIGCGTLVTVPPTMVDEYSNLQESVAAINNGDENLKTGTGEVTGALVVTETVDGVGLEADAGEGGNNVGQDDDKTTDNLAIQDLAHPPLLPPFGDDMMLDISSELPDDDEPAQGDQWVGETTKSQDIDAGQATDQLDDNNEAADVGSAEPESTAEPGSNLSELVSPPKPSVASSLLSSLLEGGDDDEISSTSSSDDDDFGPRHGRKRGANRSKRRADKFTKERMSLIEASEALEEEDYDENDEAQIAERLRKLEKFSSLLDAHQKPTTRKWGHEGFYEIEVEERERSLSPEPQIRRPHRAGKVMEKYKREHAIVEDKSWRWQHDDRCQESSEEEDYDLPPPVALNREHDIALSRSSLLSTSVAKSSTTTSYSVRLEGGKVVMMSGPDDIKAESRTSYDQIQHNDTPEDGEVEEQEEGEILDDDDDSGNFGSSDTGQHLPPVVMPNDEDMPPVVSDEQFLAPPPIPGLMLPPPPEFGSDPSQYGLPAFSPISAPSSRPALITSHMFSSDGKRHSGSGDRVFDDSYDSDPESGAHNDFQADGDTSAYDNEVAGIVASAAATPFSLLPGPFDDMDDFGPGVDGEDPPPPGTVAPLPKPPTPPFFSEDLDEVIAHFQAEQEKLNLEQDGSGSAGDGSPLPGPGADQPAMSVEMRLSSKKTSIVPIKTLFKQIQAQKMVEAARKEAKKVYSAADMPGRLALEKPEGGQTPGRLPEGPNLPPPCYYDSGDNQQEAQDLPAENDGSKDSEAEKAAKQKASEALSAEFQEELRQQQEELKDMKQKKFLQLEELRKKREAMLKQSQVVAEKSKNEALFGSLAKVPSADAPSGGADSDKKESKRRSSKSGSRSDSGSSSRSGSSRSSRSSSRSSRSSRSSISSSRSSRSGSKDLDISAEAIRALLKRATDKTGKMRMDSAEEVLLRLALLQKKRRKKAAEGELSEDELVSGLGEDYLDLIKTPMNDTGNTDFQPLQRFRQSRVAQFRNPRGFFPRGRAFMPRIGMGGRFFRPRGGVRPFGRFNSGFVPRAPAPVGPDGSPMLGPGPPGQPPIQFPKPIPQGYGRNDFSTRFDDDDESGSGRSDDKRHSSSRSDDSSSGSTSRSGSRDMEKKKKSKRDKDARSIAEPAGGFGNDYYQQQRANYQQRGYYQNHGNRGYQQNNFNNNYYQQQQQQPPYYNQNQRDYPPVEGDDRGYGRGGTGMDNEGAYYRDRTPDQPIAAQMMHSPDQQRYQRTGAYQQQHTRGYNQRFDRYGRMNFRFQRGDRGNYNNDRGMYHNNYNNYNNPADFRGGDNYNRRVPPGERFVPLDGGYDNDGGFNEGSGGRRRSERDRSPSGSSVKSGRSSRHKSRQRSSSSTTSSSRSRSRPSENKKSKKRRSSSGSSSSDKDDCKPREGDNSSVRRSKSKRDTSKAKSKEPASVGRKRKRSELLDKNSKSKKTRNSDESDDSTVDKKPRSRRSKSNSGDSNSDSESGSETGDRSSKRRKLPMTPVSRDPAPAPLLGIGRRSRSRSRHRVARSRSREGGNWAGGFDRRNVVPRGRDYPQQNRGGQGYGMGSHGEDRRDFSQLRPGDRYDRGNDRLFDRFSEGRPNDRYNNNNDRGNYRQNDRYSGGGGGGWGGGGGNINQPPDNRHFQPRQPGVGFGIDRQHSASSAAYRHSPRPRNASNSRSRSRSFDRRVESYKSRNLRTAGGDSSASSAGLARVASSGHLKSSGSTKTVPSSVVVGRPQKSSAADAGEKLAPSSSAAGRSSAKSAANSSSAGNVIKSSYYDDEAVYKDDREVEVAGSRKSGSSRKSGYGAAPRSAGTDARVAFDARGDSPPPPPPPPKSKKPGGSVAVNSGAQTKKSSSSSRPRMRSSSSSDEGDDNDEWVEKSPPAAAPPGSWMRDKNVKKLWSKADSDEKRHKGGERGQKEKGYDWGQKEKGNDGGQKEKGNDGGQKDRGNDGEPVKKRARVTADDSKSGRAVKRTGESSSSGVKKSATTSAKSGDRKEQTDKPGKERSGEKGDKKTAAATKKVAGAKEGGTTKPSAHLSDKDRELCELEMRARAIKALMKSSNELTDK